MTSVLEFLLGVNRIHLSEGGRIVLTLLSAWPAWATFLALVAGAAFVVMIYLRESAETPRAMRGFLMFLRFGLIALAILMLQEPALKLERNDVIRSTVVVLVDDTASMTIRDTAKTEAEKKAEEEALRRSGVEPGKAGAASRWELARAALAVDKAAGLRRLAGEQRIFLYTIDDGPHLVQRIDSPEQVDAALAALAARPVTANRTAPTRSMEAVLEELAGQTVTGLVLLSDGRATVAADTKKLEEVARARDIPFFALGLGSTEPPKDLEIRRASAEGRAFINEELPVAVELANTGYAGRTVKLSVTVRKMGAAGWEDHPELTVAKDVVLKEAGLKQSEELRYKPLEAGKYELTARVEEQEGQFDTAHNVSLPLEVQVMDRKVKVLYVEDQPRWEYRYLMTVLSRDPTVLVSVILESADVLFAPEGNLPIKQFPATRAELMAYDVLIIGDVDRRAFSVDQLGWIDEFVRVKGGGLIFIAGDRLFDPNGYGETKLAALVPVEMGDEQLTGAVPASFTPEMTLEGTVSPILRFEKDMTENRQAWANLPGFYWYYRAKGAKPGAQVLLVHPTDRSTYNSEKIPLMVIQRVGAGQVFFSASDETWRWRWYTGRKYLNAFWIQLVRHMALPQELATLETGSSRYTLGERAKIQLRAADPATVGADVTKVKAVVRLEVENGRAETSSAPTNGNGREDTITLDRTNPKLAVFEGEFVPEGAGKYTVTSELATTKEPVTAKTSFVVAPSREEFLAPTRDEDYLVKIAALGGGKSLGLLDFNKQAGQMRNKSRTVPNDLTDEIWDSPLAMGLFMMMIVAEWILRKKYRML